ncbi:placenta-specific gene 8 protein-like [Epinephelus fuscoguttatus]|uniref:placenta-specific gene 8 protein-like n=1 Tax=Epinephelus fuscoguttatus TaxID=293821 RepID=UPI0020D1AA7F|nr:placenta-specific gene 8 protein-like [Epinephelus fuscoguttatus]XP_049442884.1 placenta-specific gene 8 protein-like [Epinephelus fuscoguttatus]
MAVAGAPAQSLTDWKTGLCDCFEDCNTCCYGFWCCPCLACTVAGKFGENPCFPLCDLCSPAVLSAVCGIPLCVPPAVLSIRAGMRHKYGIKGSLCLDVQISCFCSWCSWCQMQRELIHRSKPPTVINMFNQNAIHVQVQPPPVMLAHGHPNHAFVNHRDPVFVNQPHGVRAAH